MKVSILIDISLVLLLTVCQYSESALTVEQMENAARVLRNICVGKYTLNDDIVDGLRKGQFPDIYDLKCYVNCVLEFLQIMNNGKFDYDITINHVRLMPDEIQDGYVKAINACHHLGDNISDDACEAAYTMLKCFEKESPEFIFP